MTPTKEQIAVLVMTAKDALEILEIDGYDHRFRNLRDALIPFQELEYVLPEWDGFTESQIEGGLSSVFTPPSDRPILEEYLNYLMASIDHARATYNALSPEQKEAHDKAQRESFVRGQVGWHYENAK